MTLKCGKADTYLKSAVAGASAANLRYRCLAKTANAEGRPDIAALFRSLADGEANPVFGLTKENLAAAVSGETCQPPKMCPGMRQDAPTWIPILAALYATELQAEFDRNRSAAAGCNARQRSTPSA